MTDFDFIIVGGGVAGLSLAYEMAHSPLTGSSILVIEACTQPRNDHALSFWTDRPMPFGEVIFRSWNRLRLRSEEFDRSIDLGAFRYCSLRSGDYAAFIRGDLARCAKIEFLQGSVEKIDARPDRAQVRVDGREWSGRWVFDSRFRIADLAADTAYCSLRQHFKGWDIETSEAAFDPGTATLFDFRVPQKNELRFFYVLPYSERRALVEYVLLSADKTEGTLREYIEGSLGIRDYRILAKEGGVTPLTDRPFPRRVGSRVMNIGIRGGRARPSTGYAFQRIQRDSAAIVRSLVKTGSPFDIPADSRFYRYCDSTLLRIMQQRGEDVKPIYSALFNHNPIERVFHFLDEDASPGENLALMLSLPLGLLWKALFQAAVYSPTILRRSA